MKLISRYFTLFYTAVIILGISCTNDNIEKDNSQNTYKEYYISLSGIADKINTRAHWDTNSDDTQSLSFTWDTSENEMKSFVWKSNAFVEFSDNKTYSATTVTPDTNDKNCAQLQITKGLSQAYAAGDIIWCVSPLGENNIDANNKITFTLPDKFEQTELNSTEHLKNYILMSGTGVVNSENTANISFKVFPAIYRFKVVNNESEELTVNEVSISGPFCSKAELCMSNDGSVIPTFSKVDNEAYAIKVVTPSEGLTVAPNATAYFYALVFPTKTSTMSDEITLSFKGTYNDKTADYSVTSSCNKIYNGIDLDSNMYYDMEVPVEKLNKIENIEFVDNQEFALGETAKLKFNITPTDAEISGLEWKSSNDDIISVTNEGYITAKDYGTVEISVVNDSEIYRTNVSVVKGKLNDYGEIFNKYTSNGNGVISINENDELVMNLNNGQKKAQIAREKTFFSPDYPILALKAKAQSGVAYTKFWHNISITVDKPVDYRYDKFVVQDSNPINLEDGTRVYYIDIYKGTELNGEVEATRFTIDTGYDGNDTYSEYTLCWIKTFKSIEQMNNFLNGIDK